MQLFSPLSPSLTRAYVLKSHDLCNIFHSGWLRRSDSFHIWNEGSCLLHPSRHQHACHPRHACPRGRLLSWPLMHLFIKHSFPMFYISVVLFLISPPVLSYLTVSLSHCSTLWLIVQLYLYFILKAVKQVQMSDWCIILQGRNLPLKLKNVSFILFNELFFVSKYHYASIKGFEQGFMFYSIHQ